MATRARLVDLRRLPIESATTRNRRIWPPPAPGPPTPPPPAWPPTYVHATVNWSGPMTPPPDYWINDDWELKYHPTGDLYEGSNPGWPDWVKVHFTLNAYSGWWSLYADAWRAEDHITMITCEPGQVVPWQPFDILVFQWVGLPPGHGASIRIQHPWP